MMIDRCPNWKKQEAQGCSGAALLYSIWHRVDHQASWTEVCSLVSEQLDSVTGNGAVNGIMIKQLQKAENKTFL